MLLIFKLLCVSPVTLLNLHKSMRFNAEGVERWCSLFGLLLSAPASSAVKSKRALHLHHDCCQMQFLNTASNPCGRLAGNGLVFDCVGRPAFIAGD